MLLKVLFNNKMLQKVGIINSIGFKIRYILIGKKYKKQFNLLNRVNKLMTLRITHNNNLKF
jgi:hypothetical protein